MNKDYRGRNYSYWIENNKLPLYIKENKNKWPLSFISIEDQRLADRRIDELGGIVDFIS